MISSRTPDRLFDSNDQETKMNLQREVLGQGRGARRVRFPRGAGGTGACSRHPDCVAEASCREAAYSTTSSSAASGLIRRAENVCVAEVERVLLRHPLVKAVGVAATPDMDCGNEVLACIVLDGERTAERYNQIAHELVRYAKYQLAYYKVPGFVAFVDALPLTASRDVNREQLQNLALESPGMPNCIDTRALK